jgi:hypothetical protein
MLDDEPHFSVLSAKTGQVIYDDHIDFSCFNVCQHALKIRAVEVQTRPAVIPITIANGDMIFLAISGKYRFLGLDTPAFAEIAVVLAEPTASKKAEVSSL